MGTEENVDQAAKTLDTMRDAKRLGDAVKAFCEEHDGVVVLFSVRVGTPHHDIVMQGTAHDLAENVNQMINALKMMDRSCSLDEREIS